MATTTSNLTADTAISGQNSNGKGSKGRAAVRVATAALGLSLLAGVAFGSGPAAATRRADSRAATAATCVYASAAVLPGEGCDAPASAAVPAFVPNQFTYREDHRGELAVAFTPDQFTYREDHRGELAVAFVPDAFTYREDHRASASASVSSFLPGRYSLWIYA